MLEVLGLGGDGSGDVATRQHHARHNDCHKQNFSHSCGGFSWWLFGLVSYSSKNAVPPAHAFADPNRKRMFLPEYLLRRREGATVSLRGSKRDKHFSNPVQK